MLSEKVWNMLKKETSFLKDYIGKSFKFSKYGECVISNYTLSGQLALDNNKGQIFIVWFDEIKQELK